MSYSTDHNSIARHAEDRRLRYELLRILHASRTNDNGGWVTARYLLDVVSSPVTTTCVGIDEDRCLGLMHDLVAKGFARHEDNREFASTPYGVNYATYTITGAGSSFIYRSAPADADIDDGRRIR